MTRATHEIEFSERLDNIAWAAYDGLCQYHNYDAFGVEHFPEEGGVLLVSNHSLATYDAFLAGLTVMRFTGRRPRVMADRRLLSAPVIGPYFKALGFVNGSRKAAMAFLEEGEFIGVAPGGMRESIRSSREKYQIDWRRRLGFVWMSILSGAAIVLAACPASDDIYTVVPNPLTPWAYKRFHLPMPIFYGRFGSVLPRPVRLWHEFSEPILPPKLDPNADEDEQRALVEAHHAHVVEQMEALMARAMERAR